MIDWLRLFKKQNQLLLGFTFFIAASGVSLFFYSLSGTKYPVTEYCFKPKTINNKEAKYCTDNKKYVAPSGWFDQERYTPANPRFRDDTTFVLSPKAFKLRSIPATNSNAEQYSTYSVILLGGATLLVQKRLKRYKREFVAYFEQLKTDVSEEILTQEQDRELTAHKTNTYTQYIKDKITREDSMVRYQDKTQAEREFEAELGAKHNELVEYQRQIQIAQFKTQLAKIGAEEARYQKELNKYQGGKSEIETVTEINYEELCPGKVGELDFYDWRDLKDDAVGIMVVGNSGSGKTSVATWIAGWLTKDEPAQVLALDPHANVNLLWGELDIHVISEFYQIQKQLEFLLNLLDRRREMTFEEVEASDLIICFADELAACIKQFDDPSVVTQALERLGCEGRKYKIVFIALNQSINTKDNKDTSKAMLSNYLIVRLCAIARQIAQTWKKTDPRHQHVENTAYSCVVCGAAPEQLAIHPTHYSYKQFKKKGNKPLNLLPINQLPLTIELADGSKPINEDWHEDLVSWARDLGRVPNFEEIKVKWAEIMGSEPTAKQVELLQVYLTTN